MYPKQEGGCSQKVTHPPFNFQEISLMRKTNLFHLLVEVDDQKHHLHLYQ